MMKFGKYAAWSVFGATIYSILSTLGLWRTPPTASSLQAAARGLAEQRDLPGLGVASWSDRLLANSWTSGGAEALSTTQLLLAFLNAFVPALLIFALVAWAARFLPRPARWVLAGVAVVACLGLGALNFITTPRGESLRLGQPRDIVEQISGHPASLLINPSTFPTLLLFAPEKLPPLTVEESVRWTNSPVAFREALRQKGWTTVALTGPQAEIRPLFDALLVAPDWRLTSISNLGYIFSRLEGAPFTPVDPATIKLDNDEETAVYLAQLAERYEAARQPAAARASLARALKLAGDDPRVLTHAASFEASRRRWQEALSLTQKALSRDPRSSYALLLKSLCLLETGQPSKAEDTINQVLTRSPDDPYSLFLSARISQTLRDFHAEARTMEKLVQLYQKNGQPVPAHYYVYLGQAYARQGRPDEALANYRLALASGTLGPEYRREVEDSIATIESRRPR